MTLKGAFIQKTLNTNCTTLLTGAKYLEIGRATNLAGLDILIPECLPGWRVLLIYRLGLQRSKQTV